MIFSHLSPGAALIFIIFKKPLERKKKGNNSPIYILSVLCYSVIIVR